MTNEFVTKAGAFKSAGKSMPPFIVENHPCGDWINGNEYIGYMTDAIASGCRYKVETSVRDFPRGESQSQFGLERCFAELADVQQFIYMMFAELQITWANVTKLQDDGAGAYRCQQLVAGFDFKYPSGSVFCDEWREYEREAHLEIARKALGHKGA